jgi:hypothetical protein
VARDNFSQKTVNILGKRAAYICSNPACRRSTLAPSDTDVNKFIYIGKAAHICAASIGGPRFDPNMTTKERGHISNGIFLCSSCADVVDKNSGIDHTLDELRLWKSQHEQWVALNLNKCQQGVGGDGGDGQIIGDRGVIIAGKGGDGGVAGIGGKGGGGVIHGDDGLIITGNGGNCAGADGRGGKPALGPTERYGFETFMWGYGRGGAGSNVPEYDRRLELLKQFKSEYFIKFPFDVVYIEAGIQPVPIDWINQRLAECNEAWRITSGPEGYILPPL